MPMPDACDRLRSPRFARVTVCRANRAASGALCVAHSARSGIDSHAIVDAACMAYALQECAHEPDTFLSALDLSFLRIAMRPLRRRCGRDAQANRHDMSSRDPCAGAIRQCSFAGNVFGERTAGSRRCRARRRGAVASRVTPAAFRRHGDRRRGRTLAVSAGQRVRRDHRSCARPGPDAWTDGASGPRRIHDDARRNPHACGPDHLHRFDGAFQPPSGVLRALRYRR